MPAEIAKTLLKDRTDAEKKMRANEFLCEIVNRSYGLLRKVTKVITY